MVISRAFVEIFFVVVKAAGQLCIRMLCLAGFILKFCRHLFVGFCSGQGALGFDAVATKMSVSQAISR